MIALGKVDSPATWPRRVRNPDEPTASAGEEAPFLAAEQAAAKRWG